MQIYIYCLLYNGAEGEYILFSTAFFCLGIARLILVDSTRAGKRIPDALSKTVPIWCCVINRAMRLRHPDNQRYRRNSETWDVTLYTPPTSVGIQEHHQIEQRLDVWAKALAVISPPRTIPITDMVCGIQDSSFDLPPLSDPLRPFWITPSTSVFPNIPGSTAADDSQHFFPILCLSASRQTMDGTERRTGGYTYIQGSGDDHELWGMVRILSKHRK